MQKIREFRADIALIFVALVWGATFLPMASATASNGVFTILFWRFLIASLIMAVIVWKFSPFKADWPGGNLKDDAQGQNLANNTACTSEAVTCKNAVLNRLDESQARDDASSQNFTGQTSTKADRIAAASQSALSQTSIKISTDQTDVKTDKAISHLKSAKFDPNAIKYGVILGLILFCGFGSQTFAFKYAQSSSVAFISGLNVVVVPFLVFLFFRHKIYSYAYMGVFLGAVGLYFLSGAKLGGIGVGEALSVVCAFSWAAHIVFTAHFTRRCELFSLLNIQFIIVAGLSALAAFVLEGGVVPNLTPEFYRAMVIAVLFATLFGFIMLNLMLRYTTPVKAALIFTLEPISAGVLGYFLGGESFGGVQILGAGLILVGILVSEIGSYRAEQNNQKMIQ